MLKHLFLSAAVSASLMAIAQTPSSLTLELSDGSKQAFPAQGLSITFDSVSLLAKHSSGTFQTPTSSISKFFFSADPAGVGIIDADDTNVAVEVFAISGTPMGLFPSVEAAHDALPAGLYIVRSGSQTFKTIVKK